MFGCGLSVEHKFTIIILERRLLADDFSDFEDADDQAHNVSVESILSEGNQYSIDSVSFQYLLEI